MNDKEKIKDLKTRQKIKNVMLRTAGALAFLALWQLAPSFMGNSSVLLATPLQVIVRLYELVAGGGFFAHIAFSLARIALGFALAVAAGVLFAALSARFRIAEALIRPYITVAKTVPVASFIVLSLIWLTSSALPVFISFLMVLPVIYTNTLEGIRNADEKLLEASRVFRVPRSRRVRYIYIPSLKPHLISGARAGAGMAWKSGIAAEVIGIAAGSVGEQLYFSKVYLDSAELLAWTLAVVIVSIAFEKLFLLMLDLVFAGVKKQWTR